MQENLYQLYESFKKNPLVNPHTGCKIKENGPTQAKLKKEFEKFINTEKEDQLKNDQPSIYEFISKLIDENEEKSKKNNVGLLNVKLLSNEKKDPLSTGIKKAYQNAIKDKFTPSISQLKKYAMTELKKKEKSSIKDMIEIYDRKTLIAQKCIFNNIDKITNQQYDNIYNSIINIVENILTKLLQIWRENAIRADSIYEELLNIDEKEKRIKSESQIKKERDFEEELCIVCLDDVKSTIYKPCGHRVCCNLCAKMLWLRHQTCPWCRVPCDEP